MLSDGNIFAIKQRIANLQIRIAQVNSKKALVTLISDELDILRRLYELDKTHNELMHLYRSILDKLLMLIMAHNVIFFASSGCYTNDLMRFCFEKKILCRPIKINDVWVRDYFFETPNKLYVRNKRSCKISKNRKTDQARLIDNPGYKADNVEYYRLQRGLHIDHNDIFLQASTWLYHSHRPLPGGNFFKVKNKIGQEYIIMGEDVIIYEKIFYQHKHGSWPADSIVIDRYRKIFNTNNIIIVPNIAYHIDCQMAYVGRGTFLVHSFDETLKHFQNEYRQCRNEYKRRWLDAYVIIEKERQVNKIVRLLQEHHFKVMKFCGTIYDTTKDEEMNIWDFKGIKSSFVNGIDVYSEHEQKHYFVTVDSPVEEHKSYFCKIMRQLDITPYFVKNNNEDAAATVDYISSAQGALRCQTNVVDVDKVRWEQLWL